MLKYLEYLNIFLTSNLHTSYCILYKCFFRSKICFPSEVQGTQQEGIESLFFLKKSAISQNHVKIFDSPDSKFSSLSSHRVFSSLMVTLFKKVIIEKLPRKKCTRIYTKGILNLNLPWRNGICVYQYFARIICPDITQSFHIFPVYRIEKVRNTR